MCKLPVIINEEILDVKTELIPGLLTGWKYPGTGIPHGTARELNVQLCIDQVSFITGARSVDKQDTSDENIRRIREYSQMHV